jgi:hypothetical protein
MMNSRADYKNLNRNSELKEGHRLAKFWKLILGYFSSERGNKETQLADVLSPVSKKKTGRAYVALARAHSEKLVYLSKTVVEKWADKHFFLFF